MSNAAVAVNANANNVNSHNLASEFKKNPDKALWLITKVFPAMTNIFDDFNADNILNEMTGDQLNCEAVKRLARKEVKKNKQYSDKSIKKNQSDYMIYCSEKRDEIKSKNPGLSFAELNRKLADSWKGLNDKARAPYTAKATADKARYESEMQASKAAAVERGTWTESASSSIKRPHTAYLIYSSDKDVRANLTKNGVAKGDLMTELGKAWKAMDTKTKAVYEKKAEEAKAAYMAEKSKSAPVEAAPAPVPVVDAVPVAEVKAAKAPKAAKAVDVPVVDAPAKKAVKSKK